MSARPLIIINANIITPTSVIRSGWVHCIDGKIVGVGSGYPPMERDTLTIDAHGAAVLPGFIDVHVHGAMGSEAMDANADSLKTMARFYASHGVSSFLATTWTDSHERISAALDVIKQNVGAIEGGATLLGVHLEGPYLNPEKCGAQNAAEIRRADRDEAIPWLDLDVIRLVSVAPEYPENLWFIEECTRRKITVSLAHTSAKYNDVIRAVELGLTHSTHTFNAQTPLNHREPGVVGAVLDSDRIRCELIADNIHVNPVAMRILWKIKGRDGVVLVSDAVRVAGLPDGTYKLDDREVQVIDGAVRLPDGTLAGSTLTMDRALKNFMMATGQSLETVWPCTSLNAARQLGIADHKGSIATGKDADLVLLDSEINVIMTIVGGEVVYQRG